MKNKSWNFTRLTQCFLTDKKRPHLGVVYHDRELPYAVSTDGKRLYACREFHQAELAGQAVDGPVYRDHERLVPVKSEFPDWKGIIPDHAPHSGCTLEVPNCVSKLKSDAKNQLPVSFVFSSNSEVREVLCILGGAPESPGPKPLTLNLSLLAPYAGSRIRLWFSGDGTGIVAITGDEVRLSHFKELFGLPWFGLVMPVHGVKPFCEISKDGLARATRTSVSVEIPVTKKVIEPLPEPARGLTAAEEFINNVIRIGSVKSG